MGIGSTDGFGGCGLLQIGRLYVIQEERQMDLSDLFSGAQVMILNRGNISWALSRWSTGAPGPWLQAMINPRDWFGLGAADRAGDSIGSPKR